MSVLKSMMENVSLDDKVTALEYFEDFIKVVISVKIKNEYYMASSEIGFIEALDCEEAIRYKFYFRDNQRKNHFDINQLAELLISEDKYLDFMNTLFPNLSSGDWSIVFGYLKKIEHAKKSCIYSLFKILAVFYTELEIKDYPPKGNKVSKMDLLDEIYNVYLQAEFHNQYSKILFFEKQVFCCLWLLIYGKKIEANPFVYSCKVVPPIDIFIDKKYSKETIMQIYYTIIVFNNMPQSNKIKNPYHYIRCVIEGDAFKEKSPMEEFYASEAEFNDCVKRWKNTKRLSFFRYLLYQTSHGNIAMEIERMIPLVKMWIYKNKQILIIDPSPDFVNVIKQAKMSSYVK